MAKLQLDLSARRTHQDLVSDHGFTGSYYSVRRYVNRLEQGAPLPFRRMEAPPGQEAQIDFGTGAPVISSDGKRRRTYVWGVSVNSEHFAGVDRIWNQRKNSGLQRGLQSIRRLRQ